ncbi:MAG: M17 family peptidase N-terminal domain-containing protein, partial [Gammaproteobacteria bacterium]
MGKSAVAQTDAQESNRQHEPSGKPKLRVVAARGSIADVKAPVVVVGSYKSIAPTSALKELDDALQQCITRAGDQGMIGSELGEVFFVPAMHKEIGARCILIAGMGEYGKFNYNDLRYLAMNVCYAVSALKVDSFASVLIGSGEGNLELEAAVKGLLSGFCDALHRVDSKERVAEYILVEYDKNRYAEIVKILTDLISKQLIENIEITLTEGTV